MTVLAGVELNAFAAQNFAAAVANDELVTIEGGTFPMGSETGEPDEKPVHEVTISTFQMRRDDETNGQYGNFVDSLGDRRVALIGAHPDTGVERVLALGGSEKEVRAAVDKIPVSQLFPGAGDIVTIGGMRTFADSLKSVEIPDHRPSCGFDRPRQPVVEVSWYEAFVYASLHGGALPTEEQFEYAARVMQASNGNGHEPYRTASTRVIDARELREYATLSGRPTKDQVHYGAKTTADVGTYPRLANGLGDMCGNVWKWMQNWYVPYSKDAVIDPTGPTSGKCKSLRGGSWFNDDPQYLRAAHRGYDDPDDRHDSFGFRWVAAQDSGKPL